MTEVRRCVGSARFGIEPHDAPVGDFSAQPSQKDGLSRMCTVHWRQYVTGLAREAKQRKSATVPSEAVLAPVAPMKAEAKAKRTPLNTAAVATVAQESASG